MTEVAFHFNAPDKLAYACRFARKLVRSDLRLVIAAPAPVLDTLDRMLWHMAPHDFVAHCGIDGGPELLAASPVVLLEDPRQAPHHDVLLNLGGEVPQGFGSFARLVEVVSASDEADRQGARTRWRHYAGRGYEIVRHDLVLKR
ncbi:DNA polymerase III subunit chi [Acidovorax sp. SRB_14]|uniref:DNA polymerase III subunit chi n=1 Tax=unclassified Acidovorax TaxID=2684926 RepID=UPI00145C8949|nr:MULTISPECIES: DNA polymerase III subunit chi [unclassified Acidovorax]NMM76466.1 DNA polymerase III subunit chi [Acidovorax sp. SRB_24]NMM79563.1 DNA polymerase III subunit chi [Acidovorax sp. SRB_14]NMM90242.1 DNA polymerase III subunit chi [Rhodococcus sp. SRB_17]